MAKITVQPRPGALSELLKTKGMTQVDASGTTRLDRKTLSKIDRGEEVKLETLQQVANKLQVTEEYFRRSPVAEVTDKGDVPEPGTIMLRKLDGASLENLLGGTHRIKWHLNAKVRDAAARKFLEDFEAAVESFRQQTAQITSRHRLNDLLSLRDQLDQLKTTDEIIARLERFVDYGLVLLGADYLFWDRDTEDGHYADTYWTTVSYRSSRAVLLSVEPGGTQSRRAPVFQGSLPPRVAPSTPANTTVWINGVQLLPKFGDEDDDIPF
jgi:transcriptional regulator with XRE-family HTH domain